LNQLDQTSLKFILAERRWNKATLPGDPGGMTMEQSHTTQRSRRNDYGTDLYWIPVARNRERRWNAVNHPETTGE
jgi:hypothetical protein